MFFLDVFLFVFLFDVFLFNFITALICVYSFMLTLFVALGAK